MILIEARDIHLAVKKVAVSLFMFFCSNLAVELLKNNTSIDPDSQAESHNLLTCDWLEQKCTQPAQPAYGASTARTIS